MIFDEDFKALFNDSFTLQLKCNYDTIKHHKKLQQYDSLDIINLNKTDTKIHVLKQEVARGIYNVTTVIATVCNRLDILPFTSEVFEVYCKVSTILMEHLTSEMCLNGVYFQEHFMLIHLQHETRTHFKKRMIKLLNKAKRVNNKCLRNCMKITRKLERIEKKISKQNKQGNIVLNSNTWLQGICENKYNNMVHDPVTIEEKRSIKKTIINHI